ncbi:MAG TPA: excinuclease ABC subunit UvrC [Leucothrix mucor]|uniref:UvrABC system protein C n=1 Tax=Leucothrix mucor TaxID=45248 RepID=A0A7V2WV82_LEUMU|nr:excinuclease ABC subunit UvrC [Leucothrix mucor]
MTKSNQPTPPEEFDSKTFLKTVPHKPGVYRMVNGDGEILYVGKAKDLKNRVSSYFRSNLVNSRIWSMVKQIQDVRITITSTEAEALLLESNLIKKHLPRYNILLRDDKGYPYLYLSKHKFPRLRFHRGGRKGKGKYFGPYPSAGAVREALNKLQKLFQVRQCEDSYFSNRSRPCLQFQIKRCSAPCTNEISTNDYQRDVNHTIKFLQGKSKQVIDDLVKQMDQSAEKLEYEKAAEYRDLIEKLRAISQQQYISGAKGDIDVIALQFASKIASIQVLTIRNGHNLGNKNYFPKLPAMDMNEAEIMTSFIAQYYHSRRIPQQIICSHAPEDNDTLSEMLALKAERKVKLIHNTRGERTRWLEMASRNALHALQINLSSKAGMKKRLLALQDELQLGYLPTRMECFDISHTQGEATVASCVVFGLEGAIKSDYRRYNISGITGGDDYAAMKQALQRRFKRALKEAAKLPNILFIDGGKGQVKQALDVIEDLQLTGIDVIGVTKGEGRKADLDTLTIGKNRVELEPHSSALHLVQQIRDEAHRFAITGHRQRRQKARTSSPLEEIAGLGPKRRQNLLKQFGGMRAMTVASIDELSKVSGISRQLAEKIYDVFHGK